MPKRQSYKSANAANKAARTRKRDRIALERQGAWDTSKGRTWVVVAFWGVETSITFCRDESEAIEAYEDASDQGADVFYAKTARMKLQRD